MHLVPELLAARYASVPVAHVEAGIRSGRNLEPFPEEIHRKMRDVMADLHFAATQENRETLLAEGCNPGTIYVTGNPGIDAMHFASALPFNMEASSLSWLPTDGRKMVLVTIHRRESHGAPLRAMCEVIFRLARQYADTTHFVLPVHPNPAVCKSVFQLLGGVENITLTPPLEYREMIAVAQACHFAMIDSGGLQEELPSLGKPALVLRNVTDRPEAISAGSAKLVGFSEELILGTFSELMDNKELYQNMAQVRNIFGDGKAAQRIANILEGREEQLRSILSNPTSDQLDYPTSKVPELQTM